MCGSIRQFSTLKMKKALTEILNGLWNKNKARRIFLEARLHLPTPASADGRGSRVLTPSTSRCHTSLEIYTRFYTRLSAAATRKREAWSARAWLEQGENPNKSIAEKSPLKNFQGLRFLFCKLRTCSRFEDATLDHRGLHAGDIP